MKRASVSLALTIALVALSWSWLFPKTVGNAASTNIHTAQPLQEVPGVVLHSETSGPVPAVAMEESREASAIWLVMEVSGDASYYLNGDTRMPLRRGMNLTQGASVETGANGKVLLTRGEESVFIGPYSLAAIAAPGDELKTTISLQRGQAGFQVAKRKSKHFSVETPFLAAVVKGTRFTVQVDESSAAVAVSEGLVEVRAHKSRFSADLQPGHNALVNRDGDLSLTRSEEDARRPELGVKGFESDLAANPLAKEKKAKNRRSKKAFRNKSKWSFPFNLGSIGNTSKKGRSSSSKKGKGGWSGSGNDDDDDRGHGTDDDRSGRGRDGGDDDD
jgi:hypothetical protein